MKGEKRMGVVRMGVSSLQAQMEGRGTQSPAGKEIVKGAGERVSLALVARDDKTPVNLVHISALKIQNHFVLSVGSKRREVLAATPPTLSFVRSGLVGRKSNC